MIRSLRSRHRRMILVVGIVTAILLAAGLAAIRSVPKIDSMPAEVRGGAAR
jgi:hypothetical protein